MNSNQVGHAIQADLHKGDWGLTTLDWARHRIQPCSPPASIAPPPPLQVLRSLALSNNSLGNKAASLAPPTPPAAVPATAPAFRRRALRPRSLATASGVGPARSRLAEPGRPPRAGPGTRRGEAAATGAGRLAQRGEAMEPWAPGGRERGSAARRSQV